MNCGGKQPVQTGKNTIILQGFIQSHREFSVGCIGQSILPWTHFFHTLVGVLPHKSHGGEGQPCPWMHGALDLPLQRQPGCSCSFRGEAKGLWYLSASVLHPPGSCLGLGGFIFVHISESMDTHGYPLGEACLHSHPLWEPAEPWVLHSWTARSLGHYLPVFLCFYILA